MAIALEFLNLIIPLDNIRRAKGDKAQYILSRLQAGGGFIAPTEWHDEHLYRDGSMGGYEVKDWIREWENMGLQAIDESNGKEHWKDICVADRSVGSTLPCDWLEFDPWNKCVHLKGTPRGLLVGRSGIVETCDEAWDEVVDALKRERFRTAIALLNNLAAIGYAKAQNVLGGLLRTGQYFERRILCDLDPEEGMRWIGKAAERGFWPSQRELIYSILDSDDPLDGVEEVKRWTVAGTAERVPQLRRENWTAEAYLYLSVLHRMGLGFEINPSESLRWVEKSAELNDNSLAHIHIGMCHEIGYATPRHLLLAQTHYSKASSTVSSRHLKRIQDGSALTEGDTARCNLELAITHLLYQSDAVAVLLLYPPALGGDPEAQFLLGQMYRSGWGVTKSEHRAQRWYRRAADQGHEEARKGFGDVKITERNVRPNSGYTQHE
jgi:TPR repeat protein